MECQYLIQNPAESLLRMAFYYHNFLKFFSICSSIANFNLQMNHATSGIVDEYFHLNILVTTDSNSSESFKLEINEKVIPGKDFINDKIRV
jgi:hypothetical protein